MEKIISYILLFACVFSMHAQSPDAGSIMKLANDEALSNGVVSICARTADGQTLIDINAGKMMLPASNMKIITTGAALHVLGGDWKYETMIGYDGSIEDGILKGDLYIIGGGDPTIGSKDSIAVSLDKTFAQWESMIRKNGITRIEGRIIGDGRRFEGMPEEPTWLWNDVGTYYGTGSTALMFYENMQSFSVSAGPQVGSAVNIRPSYPESPWMEFRYACSTGKEGTGDLLYMYTSDLAPIAEIRGTFAIDRAAKRVDCANKFPEYTCAWYFARYLEKNGIECCMGPADMKLHPVEAAPAEKISIIGSTLSPSLERIVFQTNHDSNNLFAETLFRTLGKELHQSATYDSSYVAVNDILKAMNVSTKGINIQDGSGLSRQNLVSADFLCRFLEAMMESHAFEDFLNSLPSPGGNGTLQYNMKGQPVSLRSRIRVKSGSMNGVRCYSGYILPQGFTMPEKGSMDEEMKEGTIIFSIMTNNCTSPTWKVRPLLDKIMVQLAGLQDLNRVRHNAGTSDTFTTSIP